MKAVWFRLSIFGFAVFWIVVAGFPGSPDAANPENRATSPAETWITRADDYEKKGEWQLALYYLWVAARVDPGNPGIDEKIETLTRKSRTTAKTHFKKGVAYYQRGRIQQARTAFLTTLRYDPDHEQALDYLKNRLPEKSYNRYTVKKGDTLAKIARKSYGDAQKDFLVARYNDLDPRAKPPVGAVIKLPVLRKMVEKDDFDPQKDLQRAQHFFNERQYEKVLPIVNTILKYDPNNEPADEMKNISYFQLGKAFHQKKEYARSLRMYEQVDSEYSIVDTAIENVKKSMVEDAENHYRKGIKHFINEKFRAAILEWAKTLTLNPDHEKAKRDIEKARNLLKKLEETE